ncbi:hypothetical protein VI06_04615 [Aquitalea magnusonii]|uniref:hypothetical protein n=1 Tax=Aquitalea TaxID=407217 RepID=UPI0005F85D21|nr:MULTISPECIES: hypothetical protein [Aquitalea]KJV32729.1 hypothetical protein VI06_04615 [Aquitalea magnusonii]QBJ77209.1 hypothetical protein DKK66_03240 [Aquitalea sp. USM4]
MLKKLMLAVVVSNALVAVAMADSDVRSRPDKDVLKRYEQQMSQSDAQRKAADEHAGKAIAANPADYRNH